MSYSESELRAMYAQASTDGWGEAERALLEDVVRHAEAGGYTQLAFQARRSLASKYCTAGLWDYGFPLFSRCLSEYDQRPEDFGPHEEYSLRSWYVSTVETMIEFPEISLDQLYGLLADIERRFQGQNQRELAGVRRSLAHFRGDWPAEEAAYQRWLAAGGSSRFSIWDLEIEVLRLLDRGDPDSVARARELTDPVFNGERHFAEHTAPVDCVMLLDWATTKPHPELAERYKRAAEEIDNNPYRYEFCGMRIEFLTLTGNENEALRILRRRLHHFSTLRRPHGRMEFSTSATVLLQRLIRLGRGPEKVTCPCGDCEPVMIFDLHARMRRTAIDLASRFDSRNGTDWQSRRVHQRLQQTAPVVDFLPLEPTARKAEHLALPLWLPAECALYAAQWHIDRYESYKARPYLATVSAALPDLAATWLKELRARVARNETTEPDLRVAAAEYLAAGDELRHHLCRMHLGERLTETGRAGDALPIQESSLDWLRTHADHAGIARAEQQLGDTLCQLKRYDDSLDLLAKATARADHLEDPLLTARVHAYSCTTRYFRTDPTGHIVADADRAISAALEATSPFDAIVSIRTVISHFDRTKNHTGMVEFAQRWLTSLPQPAPRRLAAELSYQLGRALEKLERYEESFSELHSAVGELEALGFAGKAYWHRLAVVCYQTERWSEARRIAQWICDVSDDQRGRNRLDDAKSANACRGVLARTLRKLGESEAALTEFRKLAEHARSDGDHLRAANAHFDAAELAARLQRPHEAAVEFEASADQLELAKNKPNVIATDRVRAVHAWIDASDYTAAHRALENATRATEAITDPDAATRCEARLHLATARLLRATNNPAKALEHTERATQGFREARMPEETAESELLRAQLLIADGRGDEAAQVIRNALTECPTDTAPHRALAAELTQITDHSSSSTPTT